MAIGGGQRDWKVERLQISQNTEARQPQKSDSMNMYEETVLLL